MLPLLGPVFLCDDPTTIEIYTLSLHDALPICQPDEERRQPADRGRAERRRYRDEGDAHQREVILRRSEEHTSELQSRLHLVCRLLLEKKKNNARSFHRPCSSVRHAEAAGVIAV